MSTIAKPIPPGTSVQIHSGRHAGRKGVVRTSFTGRAVTADHLMIELEGSLPGWFVSIPVADVKVEA